MTFEIYLPKEFSVLLPPSARSSACCSWYRRGPATRAASSRAALTMPSARRVEPAVRPASPGPALHRQVQAALTPPQTQHTPSHLLLTSYHTSCSHPIIRYLPLSHRPSHHPQVSEPPPPSTSDLLLSSLTSSVLKVHRIAGRVRLELGWKQAHPRPYPRRS